MSLHIQATFEYVFGSIGIKPYAIRSYLLNLKLILLQIYSIDIQNLITPSFGKVNVSYLRNYIVGIDINTRYIVFARVKIG